MAIKFLSEQEVEERFGTTSTPSTARQEVAAPSGLTPEQRSIVEAERTRESERGPLRSLLAFPSEKILGQPRPSERLETLFERKQARKDLPASTSFVNPVVRELGLTAKDIVSDVAKQTTKAAPALVAGPSAGLRPLLGRTAVTGTSVLGESLLEGESLGKAAGKGFSAASIQGAIEGVFGGANRAFRAIAPGLRRAAQSKAISTFTELPPKTVRKAIEKVQQGNNIFEKPFNPKQLDDSSDKIVEGLKTLKSAKGRAQAVVADRIKSTGNQALDTSPLVNSIDNFIESNSGFGRQGSLLSESNLKELNSLREQLRFAGKNSIPAKEMLGINKKLKEKVKFKIGERVPGKVKGIESFLKQLGAQTRQSLREYDQVLAEANDSFTQIASLNDELGKKLTTLRGAKNLESIFKSDDKAQIALRSRLQELDELLPEGSKFIDELETHVIREPFQDIFGASVSPDKAAEDFVKFFSVVDKINTGLGAGREALVGTARTAAPVIGKEGASRALDRLLPEEQ